MERTERVITTLNLRDSPSTTATRADALYVLMQRVEAGAAVRPLAVEGRVVREFADRVGTVPLPEQPRFGGAHGVGVLSSSAAFALERGVCSSPRVGVQP